VRCSGITVATTCPSVYSAVHSRHTAELRVTNTTTASDIAIEQSDSLLYRDRVRVSDMIVGYVTSDGITDSQNSYRRL